MYGNLFVDVQDADHRTLIRDVGPALPRTLWHRFPGMHRGDWKGQTTMENLAAAATGNMNTWTLSVKKGWLVGSAPCWVLGVWNNQRREPVGEIGRQDDVPLTHVLALGGRKDGWDNFSFPVGSLSEQCSKIPRARPSNLYLLGSWQASPRPVLLKFYEKMKPFQMACVNPSSDVIGKSP